MLKDPHNARFFQRNPNLDMTLDIRKWELDYLAQLEDEDGEEQEKKEGDNMKDDLYFNMYKVQHIAIKNTNNNKRGKRKNYREPKNK